MPIIPESAPEAAGEDWVQIMDESFILQNVRSLRANMDRLLANLDSLPSHPLSIFCTETWIKNSERDFFSISGYKLFTKCNEKARDKP